ncbi:MAG: hypothetical protein IH940_14590 [Acidobacteria bacterium]|nr:hypothetical protein [Acidobacteriota bacterium]
MPKPMLYAGALAGVSLLIGASLMVLGRGDDSDSTAATDTTSSVTKTTGLPGVETSTASVVEGDCIIIGDFDAASPFHTNVLKVPCAQPHDAEVVAVKTTPMDLHEAIDATDLESTALFLCANEFEAYASDNSIAPRVELAPLVGIRRSLMVCVARYPGGRQFIDPTAAGGATELDE